MATAQQISGDLMALSQEARKGFPAVKDAAERAQLTLRSLRSRGAAIRSTDFLRPFLLAVNHPKAGSRLIIFAVSSIQRLITLNAVEDADPPNILRVLLLQVRHHPFSPSLSPVWGFR
jgi:hypothetical protein